MTRPDPADLADLALDVAREAAELVRTRAAGRVTVAATKSSEVDVVTAADRESEALIQQRISRARPDDGFLGEESPESRGASAVRWIVDPIDGTVNFLYGLPQYAVSIAAEVDGEVVAGVVLDVAKRTEYVVRPDDEGVAQPTRDGSPIRVNAVAPLDLTLVATGFSYDRGVRAVQAEAVGRLLPRIRDVRRLGSCALDLCGVADGTLDAYVEEGVHLWDHAAAGAIARAAGARTQQGRGAGGLDLFVAAPAAGFDAFCELTRSCGFWAE